MAPGVAPAELVRGADTMMFCVSKGLGAPVGSVLCGSRDVIDEARGHRSASAAHAPSGRDRGGGHRGARDHGRAPGRRPPPARRLAEALAELWPGERHPRKSRRTWSCAAAEQSKGDLLDRLAVEGIRAGTIDTRTVRFATHKDVDDADLARAVAAPARIAART